MNRQNVVNIKPALAHRGPGRRLTPEWLAVAEEVTVQDFARLHGISPKTVRSYVRQGMPALFHPGKIAIRREAGAAWLERRFSAPARVAEVVDAVMGAMR